MPARGAAVRRPLAACALFLAFGIGARQQPTGRQPPQTPTFRAGTNLVQVDVIVADRSDRPLLELTAADFEVDDDGAPVPIAAFRFLHTSSEQTADPIRRDADEEREAKRDDVRLFAIFLDDYHVSWASQHNAIEPLVQFVQGLPPVDLVAVYNPIVPARDVRFSRDRAETIRIIRAFEGRQGIYVPPKYPAEEEHLRQLPMIERLRAQVTYTALEGLAIHLGGLKEGRKSLIVVSERLSMDLADLDELVHTANRNNVSLYPLDPRGLLVGADRPIALVPSMRGGMSTSTTDLFRVLADETSGRAIVGRNDLDRALAQVSVDTSAYYLLGYVSPHPNDGKFHAVTVRVKRPRVTVRARKGYWAWTQAEAEAAFPPPPAAVEPAVQQALNGLADSLRPDPEAPARRRVGPPDAPAPIAKSLTALGEPAMAIARLRAEPQPVARREFTRRDQVIIQVAVADPPPSVIVTLRDHLGQRLTDLPASMASGACTVRLALGSLGPGDYVVEFTATSGSGVPERRHIAFRVVP
jgi:VWFA-related protein